MSESRTYATPERLPVITGDRDVRIAETQSGAEFHFKIFRGEVKVYSSDAPDVETDAWIEQLTRYEKVNVMHALLDRYRHASLHDKVHVASIGLTTTRNLYISVNGMVGTHEEDNNCAEKKTMVRAPDVEREKAEELGQKPVETKWQEFYIEGGREPDWHIMGPCGDCTDMLYKYMIPGGKVFILPATYGAAYLDITTEPQSIDDVPKDASGRPNECWATDIDFLTRNRVLKDLTPEQKALQYDGRSALVQKVRAFIAHPHIVEDANMAVFGISGDEMTKLSRAEREKITNPMDMEKFNNYIQEQVVLTISNRVQDMCENRNLDVDQISDSTIEAFISNDIRWVRCAVIQRDDGKLFASVTIRRQGEKGAAERAEVNAMGQGSRKDGTHHYRDLWCTEFHPRYIENGEMRTSSQSAVGRVIKKASFETGTVDFHYLPFNTGGLDMPTVEKNMRNFKPHELHPSLHVGVPTPGKSVTHGRIEKSGPALTPVGAAAFQRSLVSDGYEVRIGSRTDRDGENPGGGRGS